MTRLIRSAFPNRGTAISAARTTLCKRIEMASARRFTRRSRVRCSASPSTRHPLRDPRLSLGPISETLRGSDDITHLSFFSASVYSSAVHRTEPQNILRRRLPGGCSRSPGDRRRDRKSTRLNSSHSQISYAVFCLKKKKKVFKSCLYDKKEKHRFV